MIEENKPNHRTKQDEHIRKTSHATERAVEITNEDRYIITPKGLAYLEGIKGNG